jgi:hypothetical protein
LIVRESDGSAPGRANRRLLKDSEYGKGEGGAEVGCDAFTAAELRTALLASKPFEHDPDHFFRREGPSAPPRVLSRNRLA